MSCTFEELHMTEYKMLCDLQDLCKENDITMILGYGTLLGAIRHGGFIPWDDDVDVILTYKDFKKLKSLFKKDKVINDLYLSYYMNDKKTFCTMPKIRLKNSFMPEEGLTSDKNKQGIWIDIFVFCYEASSPLFKKLQIFFERAAILLHRKYKILALFKTKKMPNLAFQIKLIYFLIAHCPNFIRLLLISILRNIVIIIGNKKSNKYFGFSDATIFRTFDQRFFDEISECKFIEKTFSIPKDYDSYLRLLYGENYMTPIRYPSHTNCDNIIIPKDYLTPLG